MVYTQFRRLQLILEHRGDTKIKDNQKEPNSKTLWSATHSYCRGGKWITPLHVMTAFIYDMLGRWANKALWGRSMNSVRVLWLHPHVGKSVPTWSHCAPPRQCLLHIQKHNSSPGAAATRHSSWYAEVGNAPCCHRVHLTFQLINMCTFLCPSPNCFSIFRKGILITRE